MFWKSQKAPIPPPASGHIEVISRHAFFSSISSRKKRLPQFSHERCFQNLLETFDPGKANLTIFFDSAKGPLAEHFLKSETRYPIVEIQEGSEAGSFLRLLDYVSKLDIDPEAILYFVEDDYLHRPGWIDILQEAFQIPGVDYATLYDHRDKYFLYPKLTARIFATASCHWRTTPSTTNTFAVRFKTLLRDLSIHRKFSEGREISADHDKFIRLQKRGGLLISSIPGWSTHAEPDFASPCIPWKNFLTSRSSYAS